MVERDGRIVCQQKSKEHETKKKKTIIITKQIISLEAKKLIRAIDSNIKKTKFYNLNKSCNNKEILN